MGATCWVRHREWQTCSIHTGGGQQLFETDSDTKVYCVNGKDKVAISPIFDWTDNDVWGFIKGNNMPYCDLYDKGFHRIGCLFCPMASPKEKRRELEMFPRVAEKVYIRAIREVMEQYGNYDKFDSPEQVFQWWVSGENADTWLAKDRHKKFFY
ncbi:phosphoadenosine phosphosulfate reductase domain-containing protein [Bacteroides pyogenes]|uniref:phosphoadenosine phosphosulfate reductase domain-containing protein n=1 Tax=Bacteroides pyogenes TaxID=310300 RepID=UPI00374DB405|nr:phosphoadenosine phosphosulfate reductase family protein [Bacteroides pyogenes]